MMMTVTVRKITDTEEGPGPASPLPTLLGRALDRIPGQTEVLPSNRPPPASTPRTTAISCPLAMTWDGKWGRPGGCMPKIASLGNSPYSLCTDSSCLWRHGLEFGAGRSANEMCQNKEEARVLSLLCWTPAQVSGGDDCGRLWLGLSTLGLIYKFKLLQTQEP